MGRATALLPARTLRGAMAEVAAAHLSGALRVGDGEQLMRVLLQTRAAVLDVLFGSVAPPPVDAAEIFTCVARAARSSSGVIASISWLLGAGSSSGASCWDAVCAHVRDEAGFLSRARSVARLARGLQVAASRAGLDGTAAVSSALRALLVRFGGSRSVWVRVYLDGRGSVEPGADSAGAALDLEHLVYRSLCEDDKAAVLGYWRAEADRGVPDVPPRLLSDVDDTFYPRLLDHSLALAKDGGTRPYPGVRALYRELARDRRGRGRAAEAEAEAGREREPAGGEAGEEEREEREPPLFPTHVTFVSARPKLLKGSTAAALVQEGAAETASVLTGGARSWLSHAHMAEAKARKFARYALCFPESRFVWLGDSGQGDLAFAARACALCATQLRLPPPLVLIHDIVRPAWTAGWSDAPDALHERCTPPKERRSLALLRGAHLVDSFVDAALLAAQSGFVSPDAPARVALEARDELAALVGAELSAPFRRLPLFHVLPGAAVAPALPSPSPSPGAAAASAAPAPLLSLGRGELAGLWCEPQAAWTKTPAALLRAHLTAHGRACFERLRAGVAGSGLLSPTRSQVLKGLGLYGAAPGRASTLPLPSSAASTDAASSTASALPRIDHVLGSPPLSPPPDPDLDARSDPHASAAAAGGGRGLGSDPLAWGDLDAAGPDEEDDAGLPALGAADDDDEDTGLEPAEGRGGGRLAHGPDALGLRQLPERRGGTTSLPRAPRSDVVLPEHSRAVPSPRGTAGSGIPRAVSSPAAPATAPLVAGEPAFALESPPPRTRTSPVSAAAAAASSLSAREAWARKRWAELDAASERVVLFWAVLADLMEEVEG